MPNSPPKPCIHAGCGALTTLGAYCEIHKKQKQQQFEATRASSTQRGYGYTWQKVSKAFLKAHPLCQCDECQEGKLRLKVSQVVDHIIPHRGDMNLFWNRKNWQAMAKECHDRKTATQDGGFKGK
jgi:5-methylcytosine-specific restriction protein A